MLSGKLTAQDVHLLQRNITEARASAERAVRQADTIAYHGGDSLNTLAQMVLQLSRTLSAVCSCVESLINDKACK